MLPVTYLYPLFLINVPYFFGINKEIGNINMKQSVINYGHMSHSVCNRLIIIRLSHMNGLQHGRTMNGLQYLLTLLSQWGPD